MRRFRTIWIAALFALLLQSFAPQASAGWQCEGRNCGTTPWVCCCESPTAEFADKCDVSVERACAEETNAAAGAEPASDPTRCASDCGCVMVLEDSDPAQLTATPGFVGPVLVPALLPTGLPAVAPLPTEVAARSIEARGPPLPHFILSTPSLRAPPAA